MCTCAKELGEVEYELEGRGESLSSQTVPIIVSYQSQCCITELAQEKMVYCRANVVGLDEMLK